LIIISWLMYNKLRRIIEEAYVDYEPKATTNNYTQLMGRLERKAEKPRSWR
jgi:hypothetical protein